MAVTSDAHGTVFTDGATGITTKDYTGITVGTGSNRALILSINFALTQATVTAVWDPAGANQSMTLIGSKVQSTGTPNVSLYGLANPVSGNKILRITWTVNDSVYACPSSYTGVNQAGGTASFPNFVGTNGNSLTPTAVVTSAVGNMTMAAYVTNAANFSSVDNTQIYLNNGNPTTSGASNEATGAATVTLTATMIGSGLWASVGTDIAAPASTSISGGTATDAGTRFKRTIFYQTIAQPVVFTVAAPPYAGWDDTLEWPRPAQPRSSVYSAPFIAQTFGVFEDRDNPEDWINWPDFAPGRPRLPLHQPWSFVPPPAQVFFPYAPWDDFTRRQKPPLDTQPLAWPPTPVATPFPAMGWNNWPDLAPKARGAVDFRPWSFVPAPAQVFYPFDRWPDSASKAKRAADYPQPALVQLVTAATQVWFPPGEWWNPIQISTPWKTADNSVQFVGVQNFPTVDEWGTQLSIPKSFRKSVIEFPQPAFVPLVVTTPVVMESWLQWPDFAPAAPGRAIRSMRGRTSVGFSQIWYPPGNWPDSAPRARSVVEFPQPAFVQIVTAAVAPTIGYSPWPDFASGKKPAPDLTRTWSFIPSPAQVFFPYGPWDDFTRRKWQQIDTQPLIWTGQTIAAAQVWFPHAPWDDFARRIASPLIYPPTALVPIHIPPLGYLQWPDFATTKRPPLNYIPLTFVQTIRTPWNELSRWPEMVPIRSKAGLHAALQQFSARFPGTITQATITGILNAFEVNSDIASITILVRQSAPAVRAAVSIQEIGTI